MKTAGFLAILLAAGTAVPAADLQPVATVEIVSPNRLDADLRQIGRALMTPGLAASLTNRLAASVGPAVAAAIDGGQPLQIHVLLDAAPAGGAGAVSAGRACLVCAFAVKGGAENLLTALKDVYGTHEKAGAVQRFLQPGPDKADAPQALYLTVVADRVLAGREEEAVRAMLARPPAAPRGAALADCALTAEIDAPACLPLAEAWLARYGDAAASLEAVKSVARFTIGLTARENAVEIRTAVRPAAGTALAAAQAAARPPPARYENVLPADALAAVAGSDLAAAGDWPAQTARLGALPGSVSAMASATDGGAAPLTRVLTGAYCAGIVQRPEDGGLAAIQIYGVSDPSEARRLIAGMLDNRASSRAGTGGLAVKPLQPRKRGETDILRCECAVGLSSPGLQPGVASLVSPFSPFGLEVAFTESDVVQVFGPPSVMDRTLDRLAAPAAAGIARSAVFTRLFPQVEVPRVTTYRVEVVRLLRALFAALPNAGGDLTALLPEGTGGIAGYSYIDGGDAVSVTRLAYDELVSVRGGVLLVGGLLANSMRAAAPAAGSPAARCAANLRRLDAAREQYALENGLREGAPAPQDKLTEYLPGGRMPACPGGGVYAIGRVGEPPRCSVPEHAIR